jgi:hypothetical protein
MAKFERIPVEVEAIFYDGTNRGYQDVCEFLDNASIKSIDSSMKLSITFCNGNLVCKPNHYIVKGLCGSSSVISKKVFEDLYRPVSD